MQRCHVQLALLPTPTHPEWPLLDLEVAGSRLMDTWEAAALQALTMFCAQHPVEVTLLPIGIFPAANYEDPAWLDNVEHADILGYICPHETVLTSMRCMNSLFRLYQRQQESMIMLMETARNAHLIVSARDAQLMELEQGLDERGTLVEHLEGQIQDL